MYVYRVEGVLYFVIWWNGKIMIIVLDDNVSVKVINFLSNVILGDIFEYFINCIFGGKMYVWMF